MQRSTRESKTGAAAVQGEDITREDRVMKRVFLSPAVIVLLALSIFPLFWSLGISFTDILRGGSTLEREAQSSGIEVSGFLGQGFRRHAAQL